MGSEESEAGICLENYCLVERSLVSETNNKACAGFLWRAQAPRDGVVEPRCPRAELSWHWLSCPGPQGQGAAFSQRGKAGAELLNPECYKPSGSLSGLCAPTLLPPGTNESIFNRRLYTNTNYSRMEGKYIYLT